MNIPRLDWKRLFRESASVEQNILRRNTSADLPAILAAYRSYREDDQRRQELQRTRNLIAAGSAGPRADGRQVRMELARMDDQLQRTAELLQRLTRELPNDTHPHVPDRDTTILEFNQEHQMRTNGKDHLQTLQDNHWMSGEDGLRVAGRGFAVLRGTGALVEHALVSHAMRYAVSRHFLPVTVPDLVDADLVEMAGFVRASDEQVYRVAPDGLALAGTAELPLLAMHRNTRHAAAHLPKRYVACGHAFRREAGQPGAATRGLYRLHQFTKVELFVLCDPVHSDALFEELCGVQLQLIRSLGFAGRQVEMGPRELGLSACRKRDIELWLPASQRFGEVTSASHCSDFQARRCNVRMEDGRFVHTMNATAVAVPRIIQCMAEHDLKIPKVLEPDLGFLSGSF